MAISTLEGVESVRILRAAGNLKIAGSAGIVPPLK